MLTQTFLADVECTAPYDQPQALTTTNMFQANHEDAYDSDVDEGPNAAVAFMANLSSTSATNNPVNEVHSNDNQIFDNVDYQLSQEMHQEEHLDSDAETEIDDNTIPYHQYLLDTEAQNVPTEVSADTSDKDSNPWRSAYSFPANEIASPASKSATPATPFVRKSRPPSQFRPDPSNVKAVFPQLKLRQKLQGKMTLIRNLDARSTSEGVECRIMESTDQPIELPPSASSSPKITMVSRFTDHKLSDRQAGSKGISGSTYCSMVSGFRMLKTIYQLIVALLINFVEKFIGTVRFGNDEYAAIIGYGQFCDGGLEVAFPQHSCHIRNYEYGGSYTKLGKSKKASHPLKTENTNTEVLHTLHMDLCGPMRTESINGKKYVLVIVDDYTRFGWVRFLRTKDETPQVIEKFIVKTQRALNATVRFVRTDNGTEFVNKTLDGWFESVGISHETSVPRSPQQNGVVERRNRTLMEAARTMLIFAKAPLFLWAEAVATACYTLNRSLVHTLHGKTYYELLKGKKPNLQYFRVFGSLCYPTNDYDDVGKLKAKADIVLAPSTNDFCAKQYRTRKLTAGNSQTAPFCPKVIPKPSGVPITPVNVPDAPAPENANGSPSTTVISEGAPQLQSLYPSNTSNQNTSDSDDETRSIKFELLDEYGDDWKNKVLGFSVERLSIEAGIDFEDHLLQLARLKHQSRLFIAHAGEKDFMLDPEHPTHVYRLKKHSIVLKQAPRAWYDNHSAFPNQSDLTQRRGRSYTLHEKNRQTSSTDGIRPDKVFAVLYGARYQAKPTEMHLTAIKRIFRYLKGTIHMGLWYPKDSGFELKAFADADYAGCHDTRRSTSGSAQFLGHRLESVGSILWMRSQLRDYGFAFNIDSDIRKIKVADCSMRKHVSPLAAPTLDIRHTSSKSRLKGKLLSYISGDKIPTLTFLRRHYPERALCATLLPLLGVKANVTRYSEGTQEDSVPTSTKCFTL
ncbi:retrovirus-related pol polyprotein from transposon TNT 1-94 [Tanacetum coccineum]